MEQCIGASANGIGNKVCVARSIRTICSSFWHAAIARVCVQVLSTGFERASRFAGRFPPECNCDSIVALVIGDVFGDIFSSVAKFVLCLCMSPFRCLVYASLVSFIICCQVCDSLVLVSHKLPSSCIMYVEGPTQSASYWEI